MFFTPWKFNSLLSLLSVCIRLYPLLGSQWLLYQQPDVTASVLPLKILLDLCGVTRENESGS